MVAGKQPQQPVINTPPSPPEAATPLAQATAPTPTEATRPPVPATPASAPAETVKPGLTTAALALVMDWQDYWYIDLGPLFLLLLILWLATRQRAKPTRALAAASSSPMVRRSPLVPEKTETGSLLFVSSGIAIGRNTEFCDIQFINWGRKPVTFETNCLVIGVGRVLTPIPSYPTEAVEHLASSTTLEAGQQFSIKRPNPVSEQDWERIRRGEIGLWLFGYIDYRTQSGARYRQGFCFNYQPPRAAFSPPGNGRVTTMGPRAYTYVVERDAYPRGLLEHGGANARENLVHP